jgi:hypothetical protein
MVIAGQVPSSRSSRRNAPTSRPVTNRRHFLRQFAGETMALIDGLQGKPQCRLVDLWELPNRELAALIPQVCPGVEILTKDGNVCARLPGDGDLLTLFATTEESEFIFNRFNGIHAIGRIVGELGTAMGLSEEESLARVRELFLRLVRMGICVPCNEGPPQAGPFPD